MARGFNGTSDLINYTPIDITGAQPQSFSVWLYSDELPAVTDEYLFIQNIAGDINQSVFVRLYRTNGQINWYAKNIGTNTEVWSGNAAYPIGEWFHFFYTWTGSLLYANAHIYVNNVLKDNTGVNGSVSHQPPAGSWQFGHSSNSLDGGMAELGWWNRVLSAEERAICAKGFSPRFIPNGLKFAPDLVRHQRDPISGQAGTLSGTTVREHPRIIQPCGVL